MKCLLCEKVSHTLDTFMLIGTKMGVFVGPQRMQLSGMIANGQMVTFPQDRRR